MQATVNLRVLDANTFLRDSLIGSYQFDLLGIYVEKVDTIRKTSFFSRGRRGRTVGPDPWADCVFGQCLTSQPQLLIFMSASSFN